MEYGEVEQRIPGLRFRGPVCVQRVEGGDPVKVQLAVGQAGRSQRVDITRWDPYLVVRSRVCKHTELDAGDPLVWTLTENATAGLGAVVVRGAYIWVEMALLADHVHDPELALAIEAIALEADQLEAKATEGFNRF